MNLFKILFLIIMMVLGNLMGNSLTNEKIILKVFELPDSRKTDPYSKAELAVVEAFKNEHPNIELKAFSGIDMEGIGMDTGPLLAIAGGVAPDILYVNFRQSDTYIRNNFLYPLDEFVSEMKENELSDRVPEPVWQVIRREGPGNQIKTWALPYEILVRVFMWRKDLFAKSGLDPEKPPKNWDELLSFSRQITDPSKMTYGLALASGPQAAYDWMTYLWSAGGDAVKYDKETNEWYASFDDSAAVSAMDFYLKLITTKWVDKNGTKQQGFVIRDGNWWKMWDDGSVGMRMDYMNEKSLGGNLDPNLYGVAPPPYGPTGQRGSELNCRMMGIFSGAGIINNGGLGDRDPKIVREAAWKYIKFYDSEEARRIRLKVMIESGFGRLQNPLYLKKYGYEEYLKYSPEGWIETFEEALKNGKPEPFGKNCQKVYEYMTYPLDECISLEEKNQLGSNENEKRENISKILKGAVERTNEKMIGKISDEDRIKRSRIAVLVAIIVFSLFTFSIYRVWKIFTPEHKGEIGHKKKSSTKFYGALMLIPAILSILAWKYVPMVMGSAMAFQNYRLVGDSEFIGLQNFADVLFDPVWWASLGRTLYYMFISLTLGFFPPVILAILLQEVSRGKLIYRIIYYLPAVISGVIVIYLWKLLYDPSDFGGLNQILMSLGFEKSRWIKDESIAMICTIIPTIWAGVGPGCLIYLAALKGIPDELYEAADIDGASFFGKIRHIVFPNLKALLIIQFIAAFIAASQQSDFILVMTFGGPNEATKVADLLIFEKAYLYLNFGIATTMAWMLGMLMIGFTVIQLKKISKMEFKMTGK
ncbi:MAG: extracellular solute-binding protein [Candidatus Delongbacteria bacterium]|nr:extracellular solute-binding protein [Candidatus Delongbacteria bacterium]MBN2835594.1 extracellular solute-binding protein [Candidatus Delongbacteria bacterium]